MVIAPPPSKHPSRLGWTRLRDRSADTAPTAQIEKKIENSRCEINVVEHCNLSCRSCSHLSPVVLRSVVSPDEVAQQLGFLARVYHARWVRLVGGEPLLHPRLIDVIAAARQTGVADKVSVVTNGVLLQRMDEAFWGAVDAVEVSLYPGKEPDDETKTRSIEMARRHDVDLRLIKVREFRESFSTLGSEDSRLVGRIYSRCEIAHVWRCHTVAGGFFYKCPPAYFLPKAVKACAAYDTSSGLRISGSEKFAASLREYLESSTPLPTCRYCLGTAGKRFPHEQVRRTRFIALQERPVEDLVDRRRLWLAVMSPVRVRLTEALQRLPLAQRGRRLK